MSKNTTMSAWVEQLQALGRYTFTGVTAESGTGRSDVAVQNALRRLKAQRKIVALRRGLFAVVPPEYRVTGSPPASWFIDDLMRHLDQPYYVGLLSASAIHGASHQQPMVFQVVTDKPTREIRAGKVTVSFSMSSTVERMPAVAVQTETGTMRVATPETTAYDLVRFQPAAGHLGNVATVLAELAEHLNAPALAEIAPLRKLPDVQRLGYLLETIGETALAAPLAEWLEDRSPRAIPLLPGAPVACGIDDRWHVRPNAELEIDR